MDINSFQEKYEATNKTLRDCLLAIHEERKDLAYKHLCETFPEYTFDKERIRVESSHSINSVNEYNTAATYRADATRHYVMQTSGDVKRLDTDLSKGLKENKALYRLENDHSIYLINRIDNGIARISVYSRYSGERKCDKKMSGRKVNEDLKGRYIIMDGEKLYLSDE